MSDVAALVLAAGQGRRFQGGVDSKLLAPLDGKALVTHVAATALASRATPVVVVTGHAAARVETALAGLAVIIVRNPDHVAGMASSLVIGLKALPERARGVLVLLADMPLVRPTTLDRLIDCLEGAASDTEAVVPTFDGRPGNPVLIARAMFSAVLDLAGDRGAGGLLAQTGRKLVHCPVEDPGIAIDIDTHQALQAHQRGQDQAAERSLR